VYSSITLKLFLVHQVEFLLHLNIIDRKYKKISRGYLNGFLGGHAYENIYNTQKLIDDGVDGIVHLAPLSCMPESTIEPFVNDICYKSDIPILRLYIDEANSEANTNTRIEAFVELLEKKREMNA
jgi:predicted nucleotide-binding protein (sugar kinase/HSP70/actin superfamily)